MPAQRRNKRRKLPGMGRTACLRRHAVRALWKVDGGVIANYLKRHSVLGYSPMKRVIVPLFLLIVLLVLCATVACAQEDDVKEYFSGFTSAFHLLMIVVWSVAYIGLYAA